MKSLPLITAAVAIVTVVSFTSCRPSRVYANKEKQREAEPPPPPPRQPTRTYHSSSSSTSSLIIAPTPGFVMKHYPDGRFYHRNRYGMLYWKGYDDRFYLDRAYLSRVRYNNAEYNQWRRYQQESQ
jgi:hypothetical protein